MAFLCTINFEPVPCPKSKWRSTLCQIHKFGVIKLRPTLEIKHRKKMLPDRYTAMAQSEGKNLMEIWDTRGKNVCFSLRDEEWQVTSAPGMTEWGDTISLTHQYWSTLLSNTAPQWRMDTLTSPTTMCSAVSFFLRLSAWEPTRQDPQTEDENKPPYKDQDYWSQTAARRQLYWK